MATFTFGSSAVSAQQITDGSRPSITVEKGYSVSTVVSAVTSNTVQGNQLEAGNSIDVNIVSPSAPPSASGKIADFEVSPNSSLVELGGINHFSLVEYGEGSSLKTSVKTKENAINYAKKKKIDFEIVEPKKRKTIKKSYSDNFLK